MFIRKYNDEDRLLALSAPRLSSSVFGKWIVALILVVAGAVIINSNSHLFGPPLLALLLTAAVAAVLVSLRPAARRSLKSRITAGTAPGIEAGLSAESLFHASPSPGFLVDCETMRILAANPAAAKVYGFEPDKDRPELLSDLLCRDAGSDEPMVGFPANGLSRHRRADGSSLWVEMESRRVEHHGQPVWLIAIADVTARINLLKDLESSERRAHELVELSLGVVFTHDLEGRLQMVNPAFAQALGHPAETVPGQSLVEFVVPRQRHFFARYLQEVEEKGTGSGTVHMLRSDGGECVWEFRNLLREEVDGRRSVLCSAIDISERSHNRRRLLETSRKDPLTGCHNRRHIEIFRSEVEAAACWAAIVVGIDHLTRQNDSHQHRAGEQTIVRTARMLEGMVRKGDSVVRLGGDEFAILLRHCDQTTLESFAVRLQRARDGHSAVPFAFGLAMRKNDETLDQTIHRADRQMIERRQIERRSVCPDLPRNPRRRAALRSVVRMHPQVSSNDLIPISASPMEAEG
jgi:diguanylate cyclase (GGDEF)-like protein/PAS domain S-box-containing protein